MTIAAVITAALALVVAIALLLRANQDSKHDAPTSISSPAESTTARPASAPPLVPPSNRSTTSPAQSARKRGDDCSHEGIVAQWDMRNGLWVCAPRDQARNQHQVGDDCSHEGIVAQWGLSSDGGWICIPQGQGVAEPQPVPQNPVPQNPVPQNPVPQNPVPNPVPVPENPSPNPVPDNPNPNPVPPNPNPNPAPPNPIIIPGLPPLPPLPGFP
ncbi:hypothetical protein AB0M12_36525 [Nocardia vinacea]|uniref:hypothetical protein n=1 Tax=Nocardia vinacea TaxID=96468 RepID=UPI00343E3921